MGWAHGTSHDGRDIGYGVEAKCDEPGCTERIDRGLSYLCGDLDQVLRGDGVGCGRYFCGSHLYMGFTILGEYVHLCSACSDRYEMVSDRAPGFYTITIDDDGRPKLKDSEAT